MLLRKFWLDELGATYSLETVLVATVGVLGITAGVASLASAVNGEMGDIAQAVRSFDQTYAASGFQINGTVSTGQPCTSGAISTASYQAGTRGSGFVQAPPNFVFQQFDRRVNLGELNINPDVAGITGFSANGGGQQQQQFAQPQFVPSPNNIVVPNNVLVPNNNVVTPNNVLAPNNNLPQPNSVNEFNRETIERLREVPVDETEFRPNAVRSTRPAARSNRITGEDCPQPQR